MSDTILLYDTNTRNTTFKCSGYGLQNLIQEMKNPVGAEIGCAEGFTTEFLLHSKSDLTLYCVDPYINYIDWNGNDLNERENVYQIFLEKIRPFSNRVRHIRKTSDDAVNEIPDNSLDFIFIDGLHTYEQVTKDMNNYYSKLKFNGIFAGHDYTSIECINKAVTEFANSKSKSILQTECDVWYWHK